MNNNVLGFSYQEIMEVLNLLYSDERMQKIVIISGGIVPWIISGIDSNRKHSDIDLFVKKDYMDLLRQILHEHKQYNEKLDSLSYQSGDPIDYGVNAIIGGIPIGFYPYEVISDNEIIQRSFTLPTVELNSKIELKTRILSNMKESDYINYYQLTNGLVIKASSLEMIRLSKEIANREKDINDIRQIDKIGIDREKYDRVKSSLLKQQFTKISPELKK